MTSVDKMEILHLGIRVTVGATNTDDQVLKELHQNFFGLGLIIFRCLEKKIVK